MKISIKILFLLSCVLILSACNNPLKKTNQQVEEKERVYSCDDLKNEAARMDCMSQVSGIAFDALNSEILQTFDIKRCVELPQDIADSCVTTIQKSGITEPLSYEEILALREALSISYKTTESPDGEIPEEGEGYYDISKCGTLKTPGLKEYCEKQLNRRIEEESMFKIIQSGDIARCDELKDEIFNKSCKMQLGTSEEFSEIAAPEIVEEDTEPVGIPDTTILLDSTENIGEVESAEEPMP